MIVDRIKDRPKKGEYQSILGSRQSVGKGTTPAANTIPRSVPSGRPRHASRDTPPRKSASGIPGPIPVTVVTGISRSSGIGPSIRRTTRTTTTISRLPIRGAKRRFSSGTRPINTPIGRSTTSAVKDVTRTSRGISGSATALCIVPLHRPIDIGKITPGSTSPHQKTSSRRVPANPIGHRRSTSGKKGLTAAHSGKTARSHRGSGSITRGCWRSMKG